MNIDQASELALIIALVASEAVGASKSKHGSLSGIVASLLKAKKGGNKKKNKGSMKTETKQGR